PGSPAAVFEREPARRQPLARGAAPLDWTLVQLAGAMTRRLNDRAVSVDTEHSWSATDDYVSTGGLPPPEIVDGAVTDAHARYRSNAAGRLSDVYPSLGSMPADLFGVCVADVNGRVHA